MFAEVNQVVRSQERRLRQDLHDDTLADSLAALQKAEEAKLRFTLIQQVHLDTFKGAAVCSPSHGRIHGLRLCGGTHSWVMRKGKPVQTTGQLDCTSLELQPICAGPETGSQRGTLQLAEQRKCCALPASQFPRLPSNSRHAALPSS